MRRPRATGGPRTSRSATNESGWRRAEAWLYFAVAMNSNGSDYIDRSGLDRRVRVLFLCTHNSSRSQMAEGLLNARLPDRYVAFSAGSEARGVHPMAIRALAELGIDITHHRSKHLEAFLELPFDWVITVCSEADKTCPFFPGGKQRLHKGFDDPSAVSGDGESMLAAFRRVRDEMDRWITAFFAEHPTKKSKDTP